MLSWTSDLPMTTSYRGMVTLPEGRPFRGLECYHAAIVGRKAGRHRPSLHRDKRVIGRIGILEGHDPNHAIQGMSKHPSMRLGSGPGKYDRPRIYRPWLQKASAGVQ